VEVEFVVQTLDKLVPSQYQNPERTKPWGTGHALLCVRDVVREPFVAINADDFYGRESFASIADFFQKTQPAITQCRVYVKQSTF
jgi:UTP-glucose-1-phosphate uridylyltransferase